MFMAFAALFSSIFEFLLFVCAVALIYHVFISDWWQAQRAKHRETNSKANNAEKIAQVKLVSDDKKDIEKFVTDNAQYLSTPTVAKLAARIELLNIDDFIADDDEVLKKRFEGPPKQAEEEEDAETARSQRARN